MKPLVPTLIMGHDRAPAPLPYLSGLLDTDLDRPAGANDLWTAVHVAAQAGELGGAVVDRQLSPRPLSLASDPEPEASPEWAEQFDLAMRLDLRWVVAGAIRGLADAGQRLPHRLITRTLSYLRAQSATRSVSVADVIRPPLARVLGGRGKAVLEQHKDWRDHLSLPEEFDAAALAARWERASSWQYKRDLLTAHRAAHPEWAQSLLPEIAAQGSAVAREGLLGAYQGSSDATGLDVFREDRSEKVRKMADSLLRRIPGTPENDRAVELLKKDYAHGDLTALARHLEIVHPHQLRDLFGENVADLARRDPRLKWALWTMARNHGDVDLMIDLAGIVTGKEGLDFNLGLTAADLGRLLPELSDLAQLRALAENVDWPATAAELLNRRLREFQNDPRAQNDPRIAPLKDAATMAAALLDAELLGSFVDELESLADQADDAIRPAVADGIRSTRARHLLHQLLH